MFHSIRRSRVATTALAGALAVGLLAGCSASTPDPAATEQPAQGDGPLGTVETMFGAIEVPQPEDGELTVVALGWSDAEMALALGITPVAVFDWQGFGAETHGVGPWAAELFGDAEPVLIERGDESLNYEQILGLDPDLILNTRSGNDEGEFDRLTEIAPTIYGPEGTGAYATEWTDQLTLVGEAVGKPDEAQALIADIEGQIAEAAAAHPEFEGLTTASVTKFGDAYGAYLPGDGRFDLLGQLGFVNNPPIADLEPAGFFANASAENVAAFDADTAVILPIGFTLEETQQDPLLSSLAVVQEGRAVFIDPDSELAGAWGASSVLSIPVVLDQLVPQLAEAAAQG
ncbi:iron-siderophore ABC transporter substrate-binding protein [Agrococcus sp. ARC_14]|uniref:iron-siderophore ABC transporter substrate-binding protein n=1 Tax=Agrococcus sp. ARC_14 TaxID=2919927 RepID=UPI001F053950|nr:iron-siderophore ABC transporter substrate-binding protein [Agrococcus sp. ARC_14]MCH1884400.1 iron-siderophore ABC transporter substrate-binding protein [Agrococcus sp. ARC_14]